MITKTKLILPIRYRVDKSEPAGRPNFDKTYPQKTLTRAEFNDSLSLIKIMETYFSISPYLTVLRYESYHMTRFPN